MEHRYWRYRGSTSSDKSLLSLFKGMIFLYKQGFPSLSHVHSGNIFMSASGCTVGGYDNTLLGYRPAIYRQLNESLLPHMDAIMFGECRHMRGAGHVMVM